MKAHIVKDFDMMGVRIHFYQERGDKLEIIKIEGNERTVIPIDKHGLLPEGSESFVLSHLEWQALLKGITEGKLNPHSEGVLEGKVDALQSHLEDMRTLVFKPKGEE